MVPSACKYSIDVIRSCITRPTSCTYPQHPIWICAQVTIKMHPPFKSSGFPCASRHHLRPSPHWWSRNFGGEDYSGKNIRSNVSEMEKKIFKIRSILYLSFLCYQPLPQREYVNQLPFCVCVLPFTGYNVCSYPSSHLILHNFSKGEKGLLNLFLRGNKFSDWRRIRTKLNSNSLSVADVTFAQMFWLLVSRSPLLHSVQKGLRQIARSPASLGGAHADKCEWNVRCS